MIKAINFSDASVLLSATDPAVIAWVSDEIAPFFEFTESPMFPIIGSVSYQREMPSIMGEGPVENIVLHSGSHLDDLRTGARYKTKSGQIVISTTTGSIMIVTPGSYRALIANCDSRRGAQDVRRIVRDQIFFSYLVSKGAEILHSSAICDLTGRAHVFVAESGGGKTAAFFCALAESKYFDLFSSERTLLSEELDSVIVRASPESITVFPDMLLAFPETEGLAIPCAPGLGRLKENKQRVQWRQLFDAFNARPARSGRLEQFIFIRHEKTGSIRHRNLSISECQDRLEKQYLGASDKNRPNWAGFFESSATSQLRSRLRDIPAVELEWSRLSDLREWICELCTAP